MYPQIHQLLGIQGLHPMTASQPPMMGMGAPHLPMGAPPLGKKPMSEKEHRFLEAMMHGKGGGGGMAPNPMHSALSGYVRGY